MKKLFKFPHYLSFIPLIFLVFSLQAQAQTIACLNTSQGEVCMELMDTEAPVTAQNFLAYINQGNYLNSFFHLSEKAGPAYLQGGRYIDTGSGTPAGLVEISRRPAISLESSVSNTRGTVAMVPDDPGDPDSVTSQFLINVTDNPALDGTNTVFARVLGNGMDVIDALASLPVIALDDDGLAQVPVTSQEDPLIDSPRINVLDAYLYDGDITDFGTDSSTDTGTPGEGQTLYQDAVCVDTNEGEFCMELFPEDTPDTVDNFLNYVESGRYDDTIIHRSVPNFVIQGGGYKSDPLGTEISKDSTVINEFNRSNLRGTVAMARISGQVNSATSEWFVNLADNSSLDNVDGGFTVFGEIISGMSVVDKIGNLPRIDLRNSLGGAFGEMPRTREIGSDGVVADDLVLVNRVYVTDVIVDDNADDGSGSDPGTNPDDGPTATTTYSTAIHQFVLPVRYGDNLYRMILNQDTDADGIVFVVDTTRIIALTDTGQDAGTMNLDEGVFTIPAVKVGDTIFTDVTFELTEYSTLTFKLSSFTRP